MSEFSAGVHMVHTIPQQMFGVSSSNLGFIELHYKIFDLITGAKFQGGVNHTYSNYRNDSESAPKPLFHSLS